MGKLDIMRHLKVMSVGELKTKFSEVLKRVQAGEEIGITYGKSKVIVARLVPGKIKKQVKRKIGILDGKGKVVFSKDFKLTTEEFLGL
jgi:antitoxin (DNA-binding transcriptional repressor) of toxin-antitoxin stability system